MSARAIIGRIPVSSTPRSRLVIGTRRLATQASSTSPTKRQSPSQPTKPVYQKTWLAKQLEQNETARNFFLRFVALTGYSTPKQLAARRSLALYEELCVGRAEEELQFWRHECDLPPTFQSWFSVTNLHVWLLTVRLRALPKSEADYHVQALVDHFFQDVEDRIRLVLASAAPPAKLPPQLPSSPSSSSPSSPAQEPNAEAVQLEPFYTPPNGGRPGKPAPERLVTQQMKIFREQLAGLSMSLDLGLARGDTELAGAVWRNLLGGRGARGIVLPGDVSEGEKYFRRSINLVGGSTAAVRFVDARPGGLDAAEKIDDGSGLHDYPPAEVDKYLQYPELMVKIVSYIRRELQRLEKVSDKQIVGPRTGPKGVPVPGMERQGLSQLRFGAVHGS